MTSNIDIERKSSTKNVTRWDIYQRRKYNAIHLPVRIGSFNLYMCWTSERNVNTGALTIINLSRCLRKVSKSVVYCAVNLCELFKGFCFHISILNIAGSWGLTYAIHSHNSNSVNRQSSFRSKKLPSRNSGGGKTFTTSTLGTCLAVIHATFIPSLALSHSSICFSHLSVFPSFLPASPLPMALVLDPSALSRSSCASRKSRSALRERYGRLFAEVPAICFVAADLKVFFGWKLPEQ